MGIFRIEQQQIVKPNFALFGSQKVIQISKNDSDLKKMFRSQKLFQISKNWFRSQKIDSDLKKLSRSQKMIQISKTDPDLKKSSRSQKMFQISKNDSELKKFQIIKCDVKHTLVLKGHPPDLGRSPGLVSIRIEGTWITIRKLPWGIHSEELPSELVETWATLC